MPTRMLWEKICTSRTLATLTAEEERFFLRLLVQCDDHGRFHGEPSILRARCFARMLDDVSDTEVRTWRDRLADVGLLDVYTVEGEEYLAVTTWGTYQRRRDSKPKYPSPGQTTNGSDSPQLAAESGSRVVKTGGRYPVVDTRGPVPGGREPVRASAHGDRPPARNDPNEPGKISLEDHLEPTETEHRLGEGEALSRGQVASPERTDTRNEAGEGKALSAGRTDRHERSGPTSPPDHLEPTSSDYQVGETVGLSRGQVDQSAMAMLDHYRARGERRADWHSTLRGWLRKSPTYDHPSRASPSSGNGQHDQIYGEIIAVEGIRT